MYGNFGKHAEKLKVKEILKVAGDSKRTPPTQQWLVREAAKLTTAASGENFVFLSAKADIHSDSQASENVFTSTASEQSGAVLTRLIRSTFSDSVSSSSKRVCRSIEGLLNLKRFKTVQ